MTDRDRLYRFLFEKHNIRGEFVQLDATWQAVLERADADYPTPVREALGEAMAAAALLVATLKIEGSLTMQIRGEGPVHLLVVQASSKRTLRGLARWQEDVGEEVRPLGELFGSGSLVITIEPAQGERYQGIVPLSGEHLHEALQAYFDQSEQLPTRLWLSEGREVASGLLLQALPEENTAQIESDEDAWNRVVHLASTITEEELQTLDVRTLLRRLFHEEDVRLFEPEPVSFRCSCSREKISHALRGLGENEVKEIVAEEGEVEVDCQFCGAKYTFDRVDVEALFTEGEQAPGSSSLQ